MDIPVFVWYNFIQINCGGVILGFFNAADY